MAFNPNYTRYSTDRITIIGRLSSDGLSITYVDNSGTTHDTNNSIATLLTSFRGKDIEMTVSTQTSNNNEGTSYNNPG